jgi:hypothetical protein
MAGPITHIVLTDKIFNQFFSNFNKNEFLIGTSFPDIRYLTNSIDRDTTHFNGTNLNLKSLDKDNSFIAGAQFHVIVDEVREQYIVNNNLYNLVPESKYLTQCIKGLEDELLYEKINTWQDISQSLNNNIPYDNIPFKLDKVYIDKWYSALREYFAFSPTPESRERFITQIGFSKQDAFLINKLISEVKQNEEVKNIIYGLFDRFLILLEEFELAQQIIKNN